MKGTDVSSVVAISSAGAVLSPSVRDALKAVLPDYTLVLNNFGASETGFQGTGVADEDARPRFEVNERTAVLDDDLRPLVPGSDQVGRVAQRRNVPLGYYNDPEKSARTFVEIEGERWVLLGDLATVEKDGTIRVLGRGSVCINSGGEKVFPEEVESALKAHPAIFDALVVGVPDPAFGQRVAAVVEVRPGEREPTADDVAEHCRTRLARYKVPRSLVIVDQIRRSPSGKADYPWASRTAREAVQ
jgi:acyl-CoA synthetase (AMP-forming)/AMP-acid ligase II